MNGLSHYLKAQELLAAAEKPGGFGVGPDPRVARAQAHATLALAAVTALGLSKPRFDVQRWTEEVSVIQRPDLGKPPPPGVRRSLQGGPPPGSSGEHPVSSPARDVPGTKPAALPPPRTQGGQQPPEQPRHSSGLPYPPPPYDRLDRGEEPGSGTSSDPAADDETGPPPEPR